MEALLTLVPTAQGTRLLFTRGKDALLRGKLPRLDVHLHQRAATTLLEALSLWVDERLCVALYADERVDFFRLGLADGLGVGARSVFYAVEVLAPPRRRRAHLAVESVRSWEQLELSAKSGGGR